MVSTFHWRKGKFGSGYAGAWVGPIQAANLDPALALKAHRCYGSSQKWSSDSKLFSAYLNPPLFKTLLSPPKSPWSWDIDPPADMWPAAAAAAPFFASLSWIVPEFALRILPRILLRPLGFVAIGCWAPEFDDDPSGALWWLVYWVTPLSTDWWRARLWTVFLAYISNYCRLGGKKFVLPINVSWYRCCWVPGHQAWSGPAVSAW